MTAPVASASSVQVSRPSGPDGDATNGPPFAAALHGALNAGREHDVADTTRRSPRSEQRPEGGERRAEGHARADGRQDGQVPGTRAQGPAARGERDLRRAGDHESGLTPSTRPRAGKDAGRSTDDPNATDDPSTTRDAADAGVAALAGPVMPPAWTLLTPPVAPVTVPAAGTDPTADPSAGVAAVAGTAGVGAVAVDTSVSPAAPGLPGPRAGSAPESTVPATSPTDPTDPSAATAPLAPVAGDRGTTGAGVAATRSLVPGLAGVVASPAGREPSATPSAAPPVGVPGPADGDSAAAPVAPPAPVLPTAAAPAWLRAASATGPALDSTAPAPAVTAPAAGAGALPDPGGVALAPSRDSGDSPSANGGDTSRQDPGVTAADPSAGVVAPPLAPAPAVPPVPATATVTPPPAPVASQVASQVVVLSQGPDGTHSVTMVLHPDDLGPVQVEVTLHQGTVDLTMRGAHEHGRAALMDAIPDLRRDLQAAGLNCSSVDVDRDTGGSWSSQHQSSQQQAAHQQWADQGRRQQGWSDDRFRPWSRTADSGDNRQVPAPTRSTSRGVDVRV